MNEEGGGWLVVAWIGGGWCLVEKGGGVYSGSMMKQGAIIPHPKHTRHGVDRQHVGSWVILNCFSLENDEMGCGDRLPVVGVLQQQLAHVLGMQNLFMFRNVKRNLERGSTGT